MLDRNSKTKFNKYEAIEMGKATLQNIKSEVESLTEDEKFELANYLLESSPDYNAPDIDPEIIREAKRRANEIIEGRAVTVDGDTVMKNIRALINEKV